ncbi:MAG: hypothetical protein HY401_07935 [Elusimicrobia bacterium]|nr:hypothetical protein [Elusimicrobiota bacterium]
MKTLDADKDGAGGDFSSPLLVRKTPDGVLILADKWEKELIGKVGWAAWLGIIGGPVLCLACAGAYFAKL